MLGTRYTSEYQTTKIDVTYVVQENETKCIFKSFGVFFVLVFFLQFYPSVVSFGIQTSYILERSRC